MATVDKSQTIKPSTELKQKLRFGVVGLGYISQVAVLPAFAHAKRSCELTALISSDPEKLEQLGKKYKVSNLYSYEQYDECLRSGLIDAVYIALPNSMHREYTVRAAEAGIHVLCEKPMALTSEECGEMIARCEEHQVRLMIAYRLHFEAANLEALEIVHGQKLGEPIYFNSVFSMQVREDNIRTREELGGGVLSDIGIYCINAARAVFQAEPVRVSALISNPPSDSRFLEVDGLSGVVMEFGPGKLATFVCSFASADAARYEVVGTKGSLTVHRGFETQRSIVHELEIDGTTTKRTFRKRDQFAPLLIYFAHCVAKGIDPKPSGIEGLADVRILDAIYESARSGKAVTLPPFEREESPTIEKKIFTPPISKPRLVHAEQPSQS